MDLSEYTEMLRRELGSVTRFGGEEFTRTAEMLADALDSSVRLTLLEVLSAATAEITARLDGTVIDVRLSGRVRGRLRRHDQDHLAAVWAAQGQGRRRGRRGGTFGERLAGPCHLPGA
jgi:hypothetical protein